MSTPDPALARRRRPYWKGERHSLTARIDPAVAARLRVEAAAADTTVSDLVADLLARTYGGASATP